MSATTETARFQFPQFELTKFEIPEAVRDIAAKWIGEGKKNFEHAIKATEELNGAFQDACLNATKGAADCGTKVVEATRANTVTTFEVANELMMVKSLPEVIEISGAGFRKQFDALAVQNEQLWALTKQLAIETMKPLSEGLPKAFNAAASTH